jgi:hypothetical protein
MTIVVNQILHPPILFTYGGFFWHLDLIAVDNNLKQVYFKWFWKYGTLHVSYLQCTLTIYISVRFTHL